MNRLITESEIRDDFQNAKEKVMSGSQKSIGIGTLSEKTVHAVLKHYYQPDEEFHEKQMEGYVADICYNNEIFEIQTANFNKMRGKLDKFLKICPVTIIYPIPRVKWLIWIDEESGECTDRRKSPKKGSPYLIFHELYRIKDKIDHENLKLKIVMMDVEEYRLLNGWSKDRKKGSVRFDRIPIEIVEEINIESKEDYNKLIPTNLMEQFTTKDYSKAAKITISKARTALHVLHHLGVVEKIGKVGNSIIYKRKDRPN